MLFVFGDGVLFLVAISPASAVCRTLYCCLARRTCLGPATELVASLVCRLPLRCARRLQDPLHSGCLPGDVLRVRILAREPGVNRSRLPAQPPKTVRCN